jgi:hypothetical protein
MQKLTEKIIINSPFGRGGVELYICETINKSNMMLIVDALDAEIKKYFLNRDKDGKFTVEYNLDSEGGDIECLFTFSEFIKKIKNTHPNVQFVSFVDTIYKGMVPYIDGVASLIYMLADERIATYNTYIMFSHKLLDSNEKEVTDARNRVCRLLLEKGFDSKLVNVCLPKEKKDELIYCRDVCENEKISTRFVEQEFM